MSRYICIHGHFYQPPRENPWLEEIELQESAYPYHDWNKRITAECYAPNTASRILGHDKRIIEIVNNYSKISFNFGPTLLSWMEQYSPNIYQSILNADEESQKKFSGHGSALAQAYNHMIMPLANTRDERTQVIWGLRDFEHRFKRKPEGMWLPETAVNIETLEILAEQGVKFTILAPHQAKAVRKIGEKSWTVFTGQEIDPQRAYSCPLPSGRRITIFFYDGPISQEAAFGGLLRNGESFANRMVHVFPDNRQEPRMVHIATDGETYGHHQRYGEMGLSYCLYHIEKEKLAEITIYGEFLEKYPPEYEVQIKENSAWSCAHGVERWNSDCGCCIGTNQQWNQKWRGPLRSALDYVRDELAISYEKAMSEYTDDPWGARDQYIDVILNRSFENVEAFFNRIAKAALKHTDKVRILKLLEMQRHAMLMYTSCGWFFDEISGIETVQIIQYAARAIQLGEDACGVNIEEHFVALLEKAPSNIPTLHHGGEVYRKYVKPVVVDLTRVCAHYALASLFKTYPENAQLYCYSANSEIYDRQEAGKRCLVVGRTRFRSNITWEEDTVSFSVLHLGDHNLNGGVLSQMRTEDFVAMYDQMKAAFFISDIAEVIRLLTHYFGPKHYTMKHLFKHEQKKVFDEILKSTLGDIELHFRQIYDQHYPLMQARKDLNIPLPKALEVTGEFVLNRELLELLNHGRVDLKNLKRVVDEINRWGFELDAAPVSYVATRRMNALMDEWDAMPENITLLKTIEGLLKTLSSLPIHLDLWRAQNIYYRISRSPYKKEQRKKSPTETPAQRWLDLFNAVGQFLRVKPA